MQKTPWALNLQRKPDPVFILLKNVVRDPEHIKMISPREILSGEPRKKSPIKIFSEIRTDQAETYST